MNKARRKALLDLKERIESLQSDVYDVLNALETFKDEEQEYLDNMPDNLQGSEKYEKAEEAVSNLEEAYSTLEDITSSLGEAASGIEEATE